jgi:hypothetical protein
MLIIAKDGRILQRNTDNLKRYSYTRIIGIGLMMFVNDRSSASADRCIDINAMNAM